MFETQKLVRAQHFATVAKWIRQKISNLPIAGSNPAGCTTYETKQKPPKTKWSLQAKNSLVL